MDTIKELAKFKDLYTPEIIIEVLCQRYTHISYTLTGLTIPKEGSMCKKLDSFNLKLKDDVKITKIISHKNKSTSIQINNKQYYTFLNI